MCKGVPIWVVLCIVLVSITAGIGLDRFALSVHNVLRHKPMGRDLNELEFNLKIGMRRKDLVRELGRPSAVRHSLAEFEEMPYPLGPPKGEEVLEYHEYPWGVFVYVDKKHQWVNRLILVRHSTLNRFGKPSSQNGPAR